MRVARFVCSLVLFAATATSAFAQSLTLAWDPNPESSLAGYELHYGTQSEVYDRTVYTGRQTNWEVKDLQEGRRYFFSVRAVSSTGTKSPFSNEVSAVVPFEAATSTAPEAARMVIGLEAFPQNGGWLQVRADASMRYGIRGWMRLPWPDYNRLSGELRPALGDLDGDGRHEIVLGLSGEGRGWLAILDDSHNNHRLLKWIQVPWPAYNAASGLTRPVVGDFDGDGRAEIAVGLGAGSHGWIAIFDDATTNFAFKGWTRVDWPAYTQSVDAETRLAAADFDGDGRADLLVGMGPGSGGWMQILRSTGSGFASGGWLQVNWPAYNAVNGATWPAAGNLDDDPLPEIVVGLGPGSGGWLVVRDDLATGFRQRSWIKVDWPYYEQRNGETRPAVGNLDNDPRGEILIGFGPVEGQGGWLQIRDDLNAGLGAVKWIRTGWSEFDPSGGGTFPAVGRLR